MKSIRLNTNPQKNWGGMYFIPYGYVTELAKLCRCSRKTVTNALRKNAPGKKSDSVRRMYLAKYLKSQKTPMSPNVPTVPKLIPPPWK